MNLQASKEQTMPGKSTAGSQETSQVLLHSDSVSINLLQTRSSFYFPNWRDHVFVTYFYSWGSQPWQGERATEYKLYSQLIGIFLYMNLWLPNTHSQSCLHLPPPKHSTDNGKLTYLLRCGKKSKLQKLLHPGVIKDFTRALLNKISTSQTIYSKGTVNFCF